MNHRMTITNLRALRNTLDIEVVKSSCFGNNFLIYDGTDEGILEEFHFPEFARQVTDPQFGIGADNFLVIQNCSEGELQAINSVHGYWKKIPKLNADYVFRMFEPDGQEALCCGNGLMCIANYMSERHQVETARIMTEIPLARVNVTTIGFAQNKSYGWVNLGIPRKLPEEIRTQSSSDEIVGEIQTINNLCIQFRNHDLEPYCDESELVLSGHLVFTGEPHLVFLLDDEDSPLAGFADAVFAHKEGSQGAGPLLQRRSGFGTWLIDHIGQYLNTHYRDRFPAGVNVNFVRKDKSAEAIEYRCYERGVYKETLACGTGAIAVAYIVNHFQGYEGNAIKILPHRCRWFKPHALMAVNNSGDGWVLEGQPEIVAEIGFRFEPHSDREEFLPYQKTSQL
jgi:diaminopimelate epimerase